MTAEEFMQKIGQSTENVNAVSAIETLETQMEAGLAGEYSSIPMIPTYLYEPEGTVIRSTDRRIVIDAGGTNFRSALGYFDSDGKPVFEQIERTRMPASGGQMLTAEEFYAAIAGNIARLAPYGGDIGFCFSYPVVMEENRDGRMATLTKELCAPGIVGTFVGARTLEALLAYDSRPRSAVILNDTVATLFGGMASAGKRYSGYIGYIYGTGTNLCYAEETARISKLHAAPGRRMIVNTECGNFNGFPRGLCDERVIAGTADPAVGIFEKMTSGKYLAGLALLCLQEGAAHGLFQTETELHPFPLSEMSAFLAGKESSLQTMFSSSADMETGRNVCRILVERAAKLGAIAVAAAAFRCGTAEEPVAVIAEGTTFRRLSGYRSAFTGYLGSLLAPRGLTFELQGGDDLNLSGALMATFL